MNARYKIGEFAKLVGLSTYTLRYYENEGLVVSQRDDNGVRFYTDEDIKWLGFLLHLKGTGMKLNDLKDYVKWRAQGDQTIPQRRALLRRVQKESEAEIREREANLAVLRRKIAWYDGKLDQSISHDESFEDYLKRFE
ncbi:MerR family transcriptional regulator [Lapidilactobacillus bayanensis]|uniref:MerR family transcriptional regulator n=1 Tax=Lapidilactobacillus bayanensis TaxID=2485998 RepID=UPI000F7A11DE|nr:MerR family transcriptional regulator [Lapidilactobacillus bayanensis]